MAIDKISIIIGSPMNNLVIHRFKYRLIGLYLVLIKPAYSTH